MLPDMGRKAVDGIAEVYHAALSHLSSPPPNKFTTSINLPKLFWQKEFQCTLICRKTTK
jgi:hypothetical protein